MIYNYFFEIAGIFILCIILFDFKNKMKIFKLDSRLFKLLLVISLLESCTDFISSLLLHHTEYVPLSLNVAVAVLFFFLQPAKIYAYCAFSFAYINPHFSSHSWEFRVITLAFLVNTLLGITSPLTNIYFYFDEQKRYWQGSGADWSYYFYFINIAFCLIYVLIHRKRLLIKDTKVAGWVAYIISCGVVIQFLHRSVLVIGLFFALSILYVYLTLENPNDYQDRLTLCANEYGFKIFIDDKCAQKKLFTVLFLDLNRFRYINSIYGIEMGDYLLQKVSAFLESIFPRQIVFRVHNDLFAVAVNEQQETLLPFVQIIINRFRSPWNLPNGKSAMLEPAISLCEYPQYFRTHTEMIQLQANMDRRIKESHDLIFMCSEDAIARRCRRRESVLKILKQALQNETLEIHYQPIIDNRTGTVASLEAISRLCDKELGNIPPDEFIAIAEENGAIIQLGFYVFEKACAFIERLGTDLPDSTVTCIHVNLSTLQFAYPDLTARFKKITEKYHVSPSMIHLELTESTMVESPFIVQNIMDALRAEGFSFSLDDYGTGYSNISYLIRFPFDEIKFDKNMVWSYFKQHDARLIMQNEFQLLHKLKKEIVVEGIETQEQYEEMQRQNIHLFQGYYFSQALDEENCFHYLTNFTLPDPD
ncbi:GGDEF domain-containing phosphodiesterase [Hespellia stercorisuis]|uniref:EAL domain, c-di-GMP-specific phosphodiesterase class I (Or its enzymatically inactive variant) n=1 Tax=Hespellia stercorisuis DSM 15480 TaxID=1121950 RepID=A0A1M6SL50_9FIRM|nr:GGDEF domain-containing phosphodiesterase [Hespellia stercorisuis]SHK45435.1 EAL domain, c-di-GMP-specific phosphodiesterase class I (or its enzymatically inactive variant) [Hespellia stercorisuis DSM 15480]